MTENPFLQGLAPEEYPRFAALFVAVALPSPGIIFHQGDAASFLYLLVEGDISIFYKPYDGPRITLTRLHPGDVFGWSSVVGNAAYTSDAIATTPARALRARGDEIRRLCSQSPVSGSQFLERLALSVAPRWRDSREQVKRLLERQIRYSDTAPQT